MTNPSIVMQIIASVPTNNLSTSTNAILSVFPQILFYGILQNSSALNMPIKFWELEHEVSML